MKSKTIFVCQNCDSQFPKWSGRCLTCGEWNTIVEQVSSGFSPAAAKPAKPFALSDVETINMRRFSSGDGEIDHILGKSGGTTGFVPGSLVLLGGDPGIGKSTLSLQIAIRAAKDGSRVLYVSGEESLGQIKLRAQRIDESSGNLQVLSENNLDVVLSTLESLKPNLAVIDSIQTMYSESVSGVAGGVAQVSFATSRIMELAKSQTVTVIIIGHVTKEGNLAGPRMLEHMVDVVLYLEGERFLNFRILRCIKNRFGTTNEVGVFEMREQGLSAVANPSQIFLAERVTRKPGNAVTCTIEGTRALLLEIQALTAKLQFSYPKRTASGFDVNRLQLIAAVLQQRLRLSLFDQDVFVSVAGGFRIGETACDLAVAMSIISSMKDMTIPDDLVIVGEVGLSGEVRGVGQLEKRISEAAKLGFKRMIIPAAHKIPSSKIELLPVSDVQEAVRIAGIK